MLQSLAPFSPAHFIDESHSDTRHFPPIKRLLQAERNTRMEAVCSHGHPLFKINCVQFVIGDYRRLRKQKNIKRYNRGNCVQIKKYCRWKIIHYENKYA